MHDTLSPNFIGYIDNFYKENGNLRISGWIVSTHPREDIVYYLSSGREVAFFNQNEREDVAAAYNTQDLNYKYCGFDLSIGTDLDAVSIYALVKGQKEMIFSLDLKTNFVNTITTKLANEPTNIKLINNIIPSFIVVDNFYQDPKAVREIALQQSFNPDLRYYKGKRTTTKFIAEGTKQTFEALLGRKISRWAEYEYNGVFQYCTAEDPLVYHCDTQSYAAVVYLTPDAPVETGTSFYRSKKYPTVYKSDVKDINYNDVFSGGFYDKTNFELVDTVGNVYNRLTIWDAKLIHSASQYFGTDKNNSRLFHLFFFDVEE